MTQLPNVYGYNVLMIKIRPTSTETYFTRNYASDEIQACKILACCSTRNSVNFLKHTCYFLSLNIMASQSLNYGPLRLHSLCITQEGEEDFC